MEEALTSLKRVKFYRTTRLYKRENYELHRHSCGNLKSNIYFTML
jgi:hypothetical protein